MHFPTFNNIDGSLNLEKRAQKLVSTTAMNLSTGLHRLRIVSNGYAEGINELSGPQRDALVTNLISLSEDISTLRQLGGQTFVDALLLQNLDGRDFYEEQGKELFGSINKHADEAGHIKIFEALMNRFQPQRVELDDELGDDDTAETATDEATVETPEAGDVDTVNAAA